MQNSRRDRGSSWWLACASLKLAPRVVFHSPSDLLMALGVLFHLVQLSAFMRQASS